MENPNMQQKFFQSHGGREVTPINSDGKFKYAIKNFQCHGKEGKEWGKGRRVKRTPKKIIENQNIKLLFFKNHNKRIWERRKRLGRGSPQ